LNELHRNNRDLFQVAFQIDKHLWTHAGVHFGWWKFRGEKYHNKERTIADTLNEMWQYRREELFDVGKKRGGQHDVGGPFWSDMSETSTKPLPGYHQIVGHTPVPSIKTLHFKTGNKYSKDKASVTYTDCLEHGDGKFYLLDINYNKKMDNGNETYHENIFRDGLYLP